MIKPTMERLLKLQEAIVEQAETLPEYSYFGTKNDLEGEQENVKLIAWCIENFEDKDAIKNKVDELERTVDKYYDNDLLYDRYNTLLSIMDFVVGNNDEYYTLYYDEKDEVVE